MSDAPLVADTRSLGRCSATSGAYEDADSEQFRNMPYYEVPADVLEDAEELLEWARTAIDVGHATATKKNWT